MNLLLDCLTSDPTWLLEQEGFDPTLERDFETLFTLSNGYLGVRGSLSVPIPASQTDLFIAGIYDRKTPAHPYSELELLEPAEHGVQGDPFGEIVSLPSPFELEFRSGQIALTPESARNDAFIRRLDMRHSFLFESMKWGLSEGREFLFNGARTVFLGDPHFLFQEIQVTAKRGAIPLRVLMKTLGSDLSTVHTHLTQINIEPYELLEKVNPLHFLALLQTSNSTFRVAIGSKVWRDGVLVSPEELRFDLEPERTSVIQRAWVFRTNRDCLDPARTVLSSLESLDLGRLKEMIHGHAQQWRRFWSVADIRFLESPDLTNAQRFNSFHLRSAVNADPGVGIGARALSGRAYEGHVFWDSEIFIFPFLLHADPSLVRAKLDYRYRTLEGARKRARQMGFQGACYAWESTVTGDDVTPDRLILRSSGKVVPIFTGYQQIHVTADIAYAISRYAEATQDENWFLRQGAEILIETARFWVSRVTERDGFFHILKVVGPDEYHHDVDDNAYTNWMARLNLREAVKVTEKIRKKDPGKWAEVSTRLKIDAFEPELWSRIADRIYFPKPNAEGVIEQFDGFFKLDPIPLGMRRYSGRAPVERLFSWERIDRTQLIKQADLLMIPFLFPDAFPKEVLRTNYDYYEPRTDHASSLSPGVHAAVAAQICRWKDTDRFWKSGLQLDLLNLMENTSLGIHLGNMGASWQALVFHILELDPRGSVCASVKEEFLETYGPVELFFRGERIVNEGEWKLSRSG